MNLIILLYQKLNFELFLSKRLSRSKLNTNYYSGPITKISISAIAVSIIVMIIAIGSSQGLESAIQNTIRNAESDIQITSIDHTKRINAIKIEKLLLDEISKIENIKHIHSIINKPGIISNNNNIEGIVIKGIDSLYKTDFIKNSIILGRNTETNNEILISVQQANKLKLKVGDQAIIYFFSNNNNIQKRKFIISGIYETANEKFGEFYAFTKKETIQKINKWDKEEASTYEIELIEYKEVEKIEKEINNKLPYNLLASSINNRFPNMFVWIDLFNRNMLFIIIVMCIVCLINLTNALLILILERLQMIGTLKSYGCSNYSILKIFLYNSISMSGKGIIIGNIIGLILCFVQKKTHIIQLNPTSYFVNYLPIAIDIEFLILINITVFLTIQMSIIIPYYIIKNISPANILKSTT